MSTNPQRREWFFPIEEAPVLVAVTHKGVARDVRVPHKKALIAADTGDMVHAFPTTKGEWTEVKAPFKLFTGSWRGTELPDKTFDPAKIRRLDLQLSVPAVPSGRAMPVETLPYPIPREAPWMAGLRAARANFVPGLIVQAVMLGLLLAYWLYPPTTLLLNRLALIKAHWGYGYSAASASLASVMCEWNEGVHFDVCRI